MDGAAYYGFEDVGLGIPNSASLTTLNNTLVAGIATDNYFIGSLGLSPLAFNISTINDPIPSILGTLANESRVPSASWGYTAGAAYRNPQVFGSATMGGYDEARIDSVERLTNISFGSDPSRDLLIELQSITYDTIGSTPLLSQDVYMFIDSMVSEIWLPKDVCENFEKAFNLTYNSTVGYYTIDDATHNALLAQNPTFTFKLGAGSGEDSVGITLPYAAFDLSLSLPITNGWTNTTQHYFPLQRGQNSSQYVLGRTFLQEAYVIADYDRRNFTVGQALFPPTSVGTQIKAICSPGNEHACGSGGSGGLSGGAIAGIVIGAVAGIALIVGLCLWLFWLRPRRRRRQEAAAASVAAHHAEEKTDPAPDVKDGQFQSELEAGMTQRHELEQGDKARPELDAQDKLKDQSMPGRHGMHELPSGYRPHEMAAAETPAVELEAPLR